MCSQAQEEAAVPAVWATPRGESEVSVAASTRWGSRETSSIRSIEHTLEKAEEIVQDCLGAIDTLQGRA